ncbi:MAG: insulinase family protein [Clostridiales bacterium]|nr:insulinase family protein [Clostridiales bacterium]
MHELITLKNGVRIIYERMPSVRSASVGIFVGFGSRFEHSSDSGSAHYIEHLLFKRTERHSAAELSYIMDGIGGHINAYTTREQTCFYAKVLDTSLNTAIELLSEMFFECAFDEEETDSERGVILEEIGMYEDTPDDACYEKLMANCFKGPLGRPVLGKPGTLAKMTGASLKEYKEKHYTAGSIVVSLCGSFDDGHLKLIEEKFGGLPKTRCSKPRRAEYTRHISVRKKKTEQNQICVAFPSNSLRDDERFAMNLLSLSLGGGVSSRLFQNIREKYGLCYSIYSFQSNFSDTGLLTVAAGVSKETEMKTLSLIRSELQKFADGGVTEEELHRARQQALSSLLMGLESTSSRMLKLGNSLIGIGSCLSTEEIVERYEAVTCEDILRLAQNRLDFEKLSLSVLGKVEQPEEYAGVLGL